MINSKLGWKDHVNFLVGKLNKYRAILYLIRNFLTRNSLKLIYNSLIYSNLLYGNIIWGNTYPSVLKPLIVAQKSILRTIMFRSRYAHTNDDFYSLGLLKLEDINLFNSYLFTYKSLHGLSEPTNYFRFTSILGYLKIFRFSLNLTNYQNKLIFKLHIS